MGSINDWLGQLVRFLELQLPPDGTGLVYLFIWTSVVEPLKGRLIRRFPVIPVAMVGIGYVGVLGLVAGTRHFEDYYSTEPPLLTLLLVLSLWLIVSGFIAILLGAIRTGEAMELLSRNKVLSSAALLVALVFVGVFGLVHWLLGEESLLWSVCMVLFLAGFMTVTAGFLAVILGAVVALCLSLGTTAFIRLRSALWR